MPLYPSCVHLPEWAVSQAIAIGALEARKLTLERTRRIGQGWAVIYFTDQLLTPCSKYCSGVSTLNGTPGGNRWARILGGQIGWLSEPLHRFEADCWVEEFENANSWKAQKIPPHGKHTTKPTSAPSTATTSKRHAKTHVPRISPYSLDFINPELVEIGHVQLSQSVKRTNVTHTHRQKN